jgi:hypothetical protein
MKIDVWKCDVCGKEFRTGGGTPEIPFHVESELDPVDGHNVRVYKHADLCTVCQNDLLTDLINKLPITERAELAKEWKAK